MANLHVNLAFSADTGKAKAQIQELQTLLSKIAYTGTTSNNLTGTMQKDIQAASAAAKDLQFHLNNAFNTTTGKFDLSLLDRSLKTSGANITDLSTKLLGAGATGQQAFMKLAQSISLADQPMFRISNRMKEFAVTMKNTVKWQLSSSMLHGFMGAIQSAYGYAQDLNKSLTDIRIVTGYSADQMAVFAEQANKAAKSLSTTTTDYTNASLIYFQQGLSDAEVAERTEVTVKMANAAGQTAQIVSDQMTAVWNNFYDGSKSLEYYADVMTALGAATATSTDEIAQGLSKFAAVADTVGLSYEFATAALATITSNTRESADVVGNALKTLFSRIQGLQLGETLEDGVDLNKYSEALAKIGVDVIDANGNLIAMDEILTNMAAQWDGLTDSQKVATAETVAGVRQYTQLMALMENWDSGDSDSFLANLGTIEDAEGTLNKQAEIYAQSWEAASKRVQAAAEGIYQSLLDDDFFISLNNGFANLLGGLDAFIDGAGGVKTVLTGIAGVVMSVFAHQIPSAIDTLKYNLQVLTKGSSQAYKSIQADMQKATNQAFSNYQQTAGAQGIKEDSAMGYAIKSANELTMARNKLAMVSERMSASEKQAADVSLGLIQAHQEEVIALKQKNDELKSSIQLRQQEFQQSDIGKNLMSQSSTQLLDDSATNFRGKKEQYEMDIEIPSWKSESYSNALKEINNFTENFDIAKSKLKNSYNDLNKIMMDSFASGNTGTIAPLQLSNYLPTAEIDKMIESVQRLRTSIDTNDGVDMADGFRAMKDEISALSSLIPRAVQEATGLDEIFDAIASDSRTSTLDQLEEQIKLLAEKFKTAKIEGKDFEQILKGFHGKGIKNLSTDMQTLAANEEKAAQKANILKNLLNEFNPSHVIRTSEALGALAGMAGSTAAAINGIISMFKSWVNPDLSGWEKISATLMGISMVIPSTMSALRGYGTLISYISGQMATLGFASKAATTAQQAEALTVQMLTGHRMGLLAVLSKEQIAKISSIAIAGKEAGETAAVTAAKIAEYLVSNKIVGQKKAEAIGRMMVTHATNQEKVSLFGLLAAKMGNIAAETTHNGVRIIAIALQTVLNALTGQYGKLAMAAAIGGIALFALGIYGIAKGLDALIVSQKEANEAIVEANDKYAEEKQKLDELNDSLKTTQDRIAELQSQESLSLVEQEELNKLLEQEASLQRQIALQEQLTQVAKQNSASTFEDNAKKASSWMDTAPTSEQWATVYDPSQEMYVDKYYDSIEDFKADIDKMYLDANGQVIAGQEALYQQYMDQYNTWMNEYNQAQAQWIEANKDSLLELTEGYQNWFDLYGNNPQYADQMMQYAKLISDANKAIYGDSYDEKVLGSMDNTFEASTDTRDKNVTNTIIKDLSDGTGAVEASAADIAAGFSDSFKNSLLKQGILPEDYAQHLIDEYSHVAKALEGTGVTLNDLLTGGMSLEDFDILAQIKITGEDDLNSILEKIEAYKSNNIEVGFNLQDFKNNYSFAQGVKDGESYSADDIAQLDVAYQQYFQEQLDGSYQLKISASEFKEIVESIELGKLKEEIQNQKKTLNAAGEMTEEEFTSYQTGQTANRQLVEAMGGTWSETDQEANIEATQAAAAAYSDLAASLMANSEAASLTAENTAELDALLNSGMISLEDYNARLAEMRNILDEDIDAEQYENLTEILQSMAEASDDNREGAQEFSEDLKDNKKAAQEVAKAILRYDSAVEDVKKNSKDWMKILKSGNLQDMANIMDDLTNSYEDMLDLDGDVLSDDFVTNAENLELMQKAAEGSEEAYNELAKRASEDIIAQCKLEADFDQAKFDAALSDFQTLLSTIDLPNLEVGADLTGVEGFIAACEQIINAAGMTADQATSYLASMGIDAEVEQETETKQDVVATSLTPNTTLRIQPYTVPAADGSPMTAYASFPMVSYTQSPIYGTKETTATALRVKSANKASGGGIKHANSSSGSGSNSKPSGGGGGSGGGSTPKYAEKKSDSDKTRYHTLTNQLEDLADEYDSISEAADRAFGKDKLNAIDSEIHKTDELIAKQEEYIAAISQDLPIDKAIMEEYYNDLIGGKIQFDENGNILNYDAIQDAMYAKYNAMASTYTEDSEEWQIFEKQFEQLEKYIEQYEETYDLLREQEAEYQDLLNQRIDLMLEKVTYKIDLQLDIEDDELQVLDYLLSKIEDNAFKAAETIGILTQQAESLYDKMQINKNGLEEVLGLSLSTSEIISLMNGDLSVLQGKTFTEEQIESIKDYRDNLLELNEEFDEIREQVEEQVMEVFDAWSEQLDDGINQLEHYGDVLESYRNIINIVGEDGLGISDSFIKNLNEAQVKNAIDQISATRDAYEAMIEAQQEAEKALEEAKQRGDEASIKMWTENLTELTNKANSAQEAFLSTWEDALDIIAEQFTMTVERIINEFNEAIYAVGGLEGLSNEFSRQQEIADIMVDDYQKIYELSKLNRDVQKSLDDTKIIAGKQKLIQLQEKINNLQSEGVEISQYDLEYLQAEYDLRMAELELEEARNAKNTVRLSQDNEGNWSYVYTQNTDAVDEAQQKYEDALYSMQDLSSNYIDEMSQQLIETSQEMAEALASLRVEDFASIDEYYAEVERIQNQYQEEMFIQEAELQKAIANNKILYDEDMKNYEIATNGKYQVAENFVTTFKDTLLGNLMDSESDTVNFMDLISQATNELTTNLLAAAETYYINLEEAMNTAGTSTEDFAADTAENIEKIVDASQSGAEAIDQMAIEMIDAFKSISDAVSSWQETYGLEMQKIIDSNLKVIESFNEMIQTLSLGNKITIEYDITNNKETAAAAFDTGGYTGEWGRGGRVAIVHEKELILDENDTINFLNAIELTKMMLETIDLNAKQASLGLGGLIATTIKDENTKTLEQQVHITAEFPSITDHYEVENALTNLVNRATQYAHRK